MKKYDIRDITRELVGHIDSIGETNYDNESIENLDDIDKLLHYYINQLIDNIGRADNSHEISVKKIGIKSNKILQDIKELFDDYDI